MHNINWEIINVKIIKSIIFFATILIIVLFVKRFLTIKNLKRLAPYKSIITTYILVFIFLGGFYYSGKDGDIYFASLYPLYISIIIASIFSVKYRSQEIKNVPEKYLLKEVKWGSSILILTLIILIPINLKNIFAKAILFALNLLYLGFLLNMTLVYKEYKNKVVNK